VIDLFRNFAACAARAMGSPWAFLVATGSVLIWATVGPLFEFNDQWQLVANTTTTIVTFLLVFLVQGTANRDARAIHLKLDELIRTSKARNAFADLENVSDAEIERFEKEIRAWRAAHASDEPTP
jgi:low affinity Fe/Cu permease